MFWNFCYGNIHKIPQGMYYHVKVNRYYTEFIFILFDMPFLIFLNAIFRYSGELLA